MKPQQSLNNAIRSGDVSLVRSLLEEFPQFKGAWLNIFLGINDNVEMVELLVAAGADINASDGPRGPEGAVVRAVRNNAINVVRWMLEHGAKLNHEVDGEHRCFALTSAARGGNLEMVKLLIEYGADPNAVWRKDSNALSFAMMYGQREIEQYLRSIGAKEPWEIVGGPPPRRNMPEGTLMDHIRKHLGEPAPLSLQQIVPTDPAISVHTVPRKDGGLALVTTGMSDRGIKTPSGAQMHAELLMYLPPDWPQGAKAMERPEDAWPYQTLQRMAAFFHQAQASLGPVTIVDNEAPLAPGTLMSCLLLIEAEGELSEAQLKDGRTVVFYLVFPLYAEERDLEKRKGIDALLTRMDQRGIDDVVNITRPSVAD